MLSSLEALAGKISPGSGKNSPNQHYHGVVDTNNINSATTTITSTMVAHTQNNKISNHHHPHHHHHHHLINSSNNNNKNNTTTAAINTTTTTTTIGTTKNHHYSMHPYQKLDHITNRENGISIGSNGGNNNNPNNNNNNNTSYNNNNLITTNNNNIGDSTEDSLCMLSDEPDPDYIKMFVGQVPKSMDEEQLRKMFEEFGRVHSINVLRDKVTGVSKGCCFVTFFTRKAALKAQDALHNVKTLVGMHHPIQMKPADSENRNERKLFVGMLNKKLTENDVRQIFEKHGPIEECTVLRDQNSQSKGCAFVTFATKQAAIVAIKTLHQSKTMEGCSAPLVVKFADTQKEKEQKKMQQMQTNLWNLAAANINMPISQMATTPLLPNPPQQHSPVLAADAISPASLHLLQQLQAVGLQQQLLQDLQLTGLSAQTDSAAAAAAAGLIPPMNIQNLAALAAMTQPSITAAPQQPSAQLTNAAALLWPDANALTSAYVSAASMPQIGTSSLSSPLANVTLTAAAAAAAGKQIEGLTLKNRNTSIAKIGKFAFHRENKIKFGPDGANLFIYHLPQEFTDTDLASTFLPFGNVISAKVFIDKQTNLSKCFGFVSFDNHESAHAAIKAMHGFQIGTKRLKVQLKKPKDAAKPY